MFSKFALSTLLIAGALTSNAVAANLFLDTFNRADLTSPDWATLGSGHIVADPLNQGHGGVLAFNSLGQGGDLLSATFASPAIQLFLSFDYLSLGGNQGSTGGYIGTQEGGGETWLAGDPGTGPLNNVLVGQWHHIELNFTPGGSPLYLKLEQWSSASSPANTAFFDNIVVSNSEFVTIPPSVPEPSSLALLGLGIAGIAASRLRRRRA